MGMALKLTVAVLGMVVLAAGRPAPAGATQDVGLELLLGVDVSGSIDDHEARLQRDGYIAAFRHPSVVKAIRAGILGRIAVAYYEWAGFGHMKIIAGWTLIHDKASADAFAAGLTRGWPETARRTAISDAINFAVPFFDRNGFNGLRRVVDISGDGPNNWGDPVTEARDAAIRKGVVINGLPIMNDRLSFSGRPPMPDLDLYYRNCVIGGPGAFIVVARDFKDFARAVRRKLILEIAGITPKDLPRPVQQVQRAVWRRPHGGAMGAIPVANRVAPPCDAGERRSLQRFLDTSDEWPMP